MRQTTIFIAVILLLAGGCSTKKETRVILRAKAIQLDDFWLEQVAFSREKRVRIDSARKIRFVDTLEFSVPQEEERLYEIGLSGHRMRIVIVNDSPEIIIDADYIKEDYRVTGSQATLVLKGFEDSQRNRIEEFKLSHIDRDSSSAGLGPAAIDYTSILKENNNRYIAFADTVSSPAAFMRIYNFIDFGTDRSALRQFMERTALRFKNYTPIQVLKQDVLDYISIFEFEFHVGDTLPDLSLPDKEGRMFSLSRQGGKLRFVDFWATWCGPCLRYGPAKRRLRESFSEGELGMVSIALDPEAEAWEPFIAQAGYAWPQLIDSEVWSGRAAKTIKFDSIPFNFLVSPEGRILRKAIPPDSLVAAVSEALHKSRTP